MVNVESPLGLHGGLSVIFFLMFVLELFPFDRAWYARAGSVDPSGRGVFSQSLTFIDQIKTHFQGMGLNFVFNSY